MLWNVALANDSKDGFFVRRKIHSFSIFGRNKKQKLRSCLFGSCFQEQFFVLKKTENTKNLFSKKGVPSFCILYVSKTLVFQIISFWCFMCFKKIVF